MNLSRKIVLLVISTFIGLVFIVAAATDIILLNSFRLIEKGNIVNHTRQTWNLIKERHEQIDVAARDFSLGLTDLNRQGMSMSAIDLRYFSVDSLKIHRIDLAALYGPDRRRILLRSIDCEIGTYVDLDQEKIQALDSMVRQISLTGDTNSKGTVDLNGQPLMMSLQALRTSDGKLYGFLVIGCFLDKVELERLSRVTGFNTKITGLATGQMSPDISSANALLQQGEEIVTRELSDNSVAGYFHLNDLFGHPVFVVNSLEKRVSFDQGKVTIAYVLLALIISAAVFCGVVIFFLRGAVLKRLATLSNTVEKISLTRDISARLDVRGDDELSAVAGSINRMLESLESAELSLKDSEERYRALFERAPDGILIIGTEDDEAGRIVAANPAVAEQHGYTVEEICGMTIFDLNTEETNLAAPGMIKDISDGEWISREVWHRKKDGTQFPIEIHAGPLILGGRKYILGFDRDITKRKMAEESDRLYLEQIHGLNVELSGQKTSLELANKELETFNYSVSHDMRGPLTRISGYCQLLLEDDSGIDPQSRTYVSRIYESSCWLDDMIGAMLKLAQVTRADFVPVQVNLSDLCREQLDTLRLEEPGRSVTVAVEPGVTACGDASLLKILIANLLTNAWKYSARTELARIEFGVLRDGPIPVYYVRDNGAGFDRGDTAKLFRPFVRLHDPAAYSGSGIGLATVQRIISRHGGRVWAEGEVGQGATFFFTLSSEPLTA